MNSFYSEEELAQIGLKTYGENVLISRNASIYGAENISIGNNVRIDDFCILSGKISIGNYVHIAAYCGLFSGTEGIVMEDFSGLSSRVTIYAASDDYSGDVLTNPTVPDEYKKIVGGQVTICRHVIIGASCVILPGVTLAEGSAFGSMSLINKNSNEWTIHAGIPCKAVKPRSKNLLQHEQKLMGKI
jgi:galactoside O-acetyltransferase